MLRHTPVSHLESPAPPSKRSRLPSPASGLIALALLLTCSLGAYAGGGGKLPFDKDHKKGILASRAAGRPFVLYFTADW